MEQLYLFKLRSKDIWGRIDERQYVGVRIPFPPCLLEKGEIAITSDRPEVIPYRVIKREYVVDLKRVLAMSTRPGPSGVTGAERKPTEDNGRPAQDTVIPAVNPDRVWKVMSSKGDKRYKVTLTGRTYTCECAGFQYRQRCRHIDQVVAARRAKGEL